MTSTVRHERTVGELALSLLCHGVALDSRMVGVTEAQEALRRFTYPDELGNGQIALALSPHWHLEIPLAATHPSASRLRLTETAAKIDHCNEEWNIDLVPQPELLSEPMPSGLPRSALCRSQCGFLLFHPFTLVAEGGERRVHIIPPGRGESLPLSYDDLLDTIGAALREGEIDCVALRWVSRVTAGEIDMALGPLMRSIKRNFDVVLSIECPPPIGTGAVDLLYAEGVDAISMPVHALATAAEASVPRLAPLHETLQALSRAAAVFPRGGVMSPLLVGLESPLDTQSSITRLAQMGVRAGLDLSLLRAEWTSLRRVWKPEDVQALWIHLDEELAEFKLLRPWVPHPRALMMSIPTAAFGQHDLSGDLHLREKRGGAMQVIVRNLIRLRRRLRVRRVEQSFESAEL